MKRFAIAGIALALGLTMAAGATQAQSAGQVEVEHNGTCPDDDTLRGFPRVTQPTVGIGWTLTKLPGTFLEQAETGSAITDKLVPFNAPLTVFGFSADQTRLFVRWRADDSDRGNVNNKSGGILTSPACGWIPVEAVLVPRGKQFVDRFKVPQPLQMRDISKSQEMAQNLLNVKAVVHDLSISGDQGGIDVFEDPKSAVPTDKIRLFDAFLVFDEVGVPSKGQGEENRYWLIGELAGNATVPSLKGWIRQRDVVIWPSRLAVQWNEEATVAGYATPENLNRKTAPLTLPSRVERADYPDQITRRLPVLEQLPSPEIVLNVIKPGGTLEERKAKAEETIQYYKIATPGRACRKDNPNDCIPAREIDVQRGKAAIAEQAATKMDILILIDATESMDPYLPSTVQIIENFLQQTEDEKVRRQYDLRFGIALYGDYQTQEPSIDKLDYREVVSFFKPTPGELDTSSMLRTLVQNPKSLLFSDVHRDKLEAPFAALIRAARTTRWRPPNEVPLRFIIHIGDSGNRDQGATSAITQRTRYPGDPDNQGTPPRSTIREAYGVSDVVRALKESNIIYVPVLIQKGSPEKPSPTLWNRILKDQSEYILDQLGIDAPEKKAEITYTDEERRKREEKLLRAVGRILKAVEDRIEYQKCGPDSRSSRCIDLKSDEATVKSPEIVNLVNRIGSMTAGLTPQEVENIYSRDQSIVTMYSPARSVEGRSMFTHWVALDQREFGQLRNLLKSLCTSMSEQDSRNPVMKALREFSEMYSNEDFSDLTIREILGKRLGIPNLEQTDFSGRSRDEIDDAYRAWQQKTDPGTWERWHVRACKARHFTQLMEDGKKVDPNLVKCNLQTGDCRNPEAQERRFRWSVQLSQGPPTYYVPLDILP